MEQTKTKLLVLLMIMMVSLVIFSNTITISMSFGYAEDLSTQDKEEEEGDKDMQICSNYGGDWDNKERWCIIEDEEETAAYEDALCDDPKDTMKYSRCH